MWSCFGQGIRSNELQRSCPTYITHFFQQLSSRICVWSIIRTKRIYLLSSCSLYVLSICVFCLFVFGFFNLLFILYLWYMWYNSIGQNVFLHLSKWFVWLLKTLPFSALDSWILGLSAQPVQHKGNPIPQLRFSCREGKLKPMMRMKDDRGVFSGERWMLKYKFCN